MADIGIATGCFYGRDLSLHEEVERAVAAGADGVELTFGTRDAVAAADPDAIAPLLDDLAFATVHAPIRDPFQRDAASERTAEQLETFRAAVGASTIVVHPPMVPDLVWAADRMTVAVENMQARKEFDRDDLAAFVDDAVPVVIDVCHAATWGGDEIDRLFETYGDRCSHVHLSAYGEDEHELLVDNPGFLDGIVHHLHSRRIVLENREPDVDRLREEVAHVRDRL